MVQLWEVTGGVDKGGILVRNGKDLNSAALEARLPTGARVEQVAVVGDRLQFRQIHSSGSGPQTGWVSISLKGKELMRRIVAQTANDPDARQARIWCLSDVHTEHRANLAWIERLSLRKYQDDVLLLAGDVAAKLERIEETLSLLLQRFARVFFVPGNHDLWVTKADGMDSVEKLEKIFALCDRIGVDTRPAVVSAGNSHHVLLVPLYSWYHSSFDTEPDLVGWEGVRPVTFMSDFTGTRWPHNLSMEDTSVAELLDGENDTRIGTGLQIHDHSASSFDDLCKLSSAGAFSAVISFSHFLPRIELFPERRFSNFPNLMKAVGSTLLGRRVERLQPNIHVFGHTHYGWDCEIDGVRYLQAALGSANERKQDPLRLTMDDFLVDWSEDGETEPLLVLDYAVRQPPRRRACFSTMYEHLPRRPDIQSVIAPWAAQGLNAVSSGPGRVGLCGQPPPWIFHLDEIKKRFIKRLLDGPSPANYGLRVGDNLHEITASELKNCREKGVMLFDARPSAAFSKGHIPGAIAAEDVASLAFGDLTAVIALFGSLNDEDCLKVVYGSVQTPAEAKLVAQNLMILAFAQSSSFQLLRGGFEAWVEAGGLSESLAMH